MQYQIPYWRSTLSRFAKDVSLSETKQAVRLKLKLPVGEDIRLTRIESGAHIDLDDGKMRLSFCLVFVLEYS